METLAPPIGPTGSITPGQSITSRFTKLAQPGELVVDENLQATWDAVTALYNHTDARCDGDTQGYKPEGAAHDVNWRPWLNYLFAQPHTMPEAPEDGQLTQIQQEAFVNMRSHMDVMGMGGTQRFDFVRALSEWLHASNQAQHARDIGRLSIWRQREGDAVAQLYTSVVPHALRGPRFGRFVHDTQLLGRYAKLNDSRLDLHRDRDIKVGEGENEHWLGELEPHPLDRLNLRLRASLIGLRFAARRPGQVLGLVGKMRASKKNQTGEHNAQRVNR